MGPYKPLRDWVDEFIPLLYGNNGSLDPIAHLVKDKDPLVATACEPRLQRNNMPDVYPFFLRPLTA